MRRSHIFTALLLIFCCLSQFAPARASGPLPTFTAQELRQGFRNGRILAKPRATSALVELQKQERLHGATLHSDSNRTGRLRILDFANEKNVRDVARALKASGLYEYVEPDFIRHPHVVPTDPQFSLQWSLQNTGQSGGLVGADISAVTAWDTRHDASNVIVAVIDSGLNTSHEDLTGILWQNPKEIAGNKIDDDKNGYVDDVNGVNVLVPKGSANDGDVTDSQGHGTAVTSIIAATGNNGKGISGVVWKTQIMACKFNDASDGSTVSNEIICLNYAVANGAKVVNISYGSSAYSQSEYDAIVAARNAGVIVVASAGNDGASNDNVIEYPASYELENIISVANTNRNDILDPSSTYGGLVDLAAPGTDVIVCAYNNNKGYESGTGTSFAAPHVTGSLALLAAQFPTDSYRQLINRLLRSVDPLSSLTGKVTTGGRLNLRKALTSTDNRPFNDDFASASSIELASTTVRACSIGATNESGEPNHGSTGGGSLWWTWTAPSSGTTVVDTTGSNFQTVAAVYTAGGKAVAFANLAQPTGDTYVGSQTDRLTFNAVSGTTYYIAVEGKNSAAGMVVLSVGLQPSNDNFASASALTTDTGKITGTTLNAGREAGEPTVTGDGATGAGKTVWYKWTAPTSDYYAFSAFTSSFSPIIGVFTGSSVNALSNVQTDTDAVNFYASANNVYYIAVDSTDGNAGGFTLTYLRGQAVPLGVTATPSAALTSNGGFVLVDSGSDFVFYQSASNQFQTHIGGTLDVNTPAVLDNNTFYVSTSTGLYTLKTGGTMAWSKQYNGVASSPAIAADGTVYIHSDDGVLHALTSTGTEKWTAAVPGASYSSPSIAADGTIYIGSDNNNFYAINPADGSIKWTFNAAGQVYSSPAIDSDGTIYFGTLASQFYALTPSGSQKWVYTAGGNISSSPAIGSDGTIYFGCYDDKLYALTTTGVLKWTFTTGDQIRGSSPAVASDGTIYIGSYDGKLYGVSPSGAQTSSYSTGAAIRSSPVIDPTSGLIFGSNDERVYLIDLGSVGPANSPWPMFKQNPQRTSRSLPSNNPLLISTQPASTTIAVGSTVTLSVSAQGQGPITYQWFLNGTPIAGATQSTYTITNATDASAGNYTVVATSSSGSVTSNAATVTLATVSTIGRISNVSARAVAGTGAQTFIVGFVVGSGTGTKPILVRGIGPSLQARGVTGFLDDPALKLFSGSTQIGSNDDWGTDSQVPAASAQVNAAAFTSSKDSALVANLGAGGYTAQVTPGATSKLSSGVALAEFYDASPVFTSNSPSLINISARAQVGQGDQVLIVGFIIPGSTAVKVLIRGLGPELTKQSVTGVLADPTMRLTDLSGNVLQQNDNWGESTNLSAIQAAMTQVGTTVLDPGSKDAVILATLQPGGYTVIVSGVNNTTGVGLAEVYVVP